MRIAHVYAVLFEDGCVKVGMSESVKRRVSRIKRPISMGESAKIDRVVFAEPLLHRQAAEVEAAVCAKLAMEATRVVGREWFYGVDFRRARDICGEQIGLSDTAAWRETRAEHLARDAEKDRFHARWARWRAYRESRGHGRNILINMEDR